MLVDVCKETTFLTSMVFIILVGATAFGLVFRGVGGDDVLVHLLERTNLSSQLFLAFVLIGIFIAGAFIDFIEIIFIFVPVITPLLLKYDFNLIWVGVLITVCLQTSFLTPPFGFTLFYLKGVAPPEISTGDVYRGVVPFIALQLLMVALLLFYPEIVSFISVSARH